MSEDEQQEVLLFPSELLTEFGVEFDDGTECYMDKKGRVLDIDDAISIWARLKGLGASAEELKAGLLGAFRELKLPRSGRTAMSDDEAWVRREVQKRLRDKVPSREEVLATIRKAAYVLGDPEDLKGLKERAEAAQRILFAELWKSWAEDEKRGSSQKMGKRPNPPKWLVVQFLGHGEKGN